MDGTFASMLTSETATYPLKIFLFGSFQVTLQGQPVTAFRSNKVRALLAYLVLAQSKPIARTTLAALLWPDYTPNSARTNLRQTLSNLREVLSPFDLLRADYQTVQLLVDPDLIWCDALRFNELFDACQRHDHQALSACPACRARLQQAIALYQGPLLAHFSAVDSTAFTAWLHNQQNHYAERFAQSCLAVMPQPLGNLAASSQATVAPPVARQPPRHNLPHQRTSFIGRQAALVELKTWLTAMAVAKTAAVGRLITLTGAGGVGKTRLSLQVAAEVLPTFRDGVWLIELAALTDATLLAVTVATILGVRAEADRPLSMTLNEWLADKQLLLILDNCEHLLADCARFADALLRTNARLSILASSREALGIAGELRYEVAALAFPVATATPLAERALTQYEAVRLFSERAQLVQPAFSITQANAPAIAEICQRLDGIPLALELAAARVKALPVETIAARLDDRFQLLVSGNRAALPRHQTLRALVDWSYDLLSTAEQILLRRLAIFGGGWTLEAAEAICADPLHAYALPGEHVGLASASVLDCLLRLVEQSLVVLDEQGNAPRYHLLETLRAYALEKLRAANEFDALGVRHTQFFLKLAAASEPGFVRDQRTQWLHRLRQEHDNLQAALTWACGHDPAVASELAGLLRWYWTFSDQLTIAENWYQRVLALYNPIPVTYARALALLGMGLITADLHTKQAARPFLVESINGWQAVHDPEKLGEAFSWLFYVMLFSGEAEAICTFCDQQEALVREATAPYILAHTLNFWGRALILARRDFAAAQRLHEEALRLGQQWQDPLILGKTYQSLGYMTMQQGDYVIAHRYFADALTWRRQAGIQWLVGIALYNVADLLTLQGDDGGANVVYLQSLAVLRAVGLQSGISYLLASLGDLAIRQGDYKRAATYCAETVALYQTRGVETGVIHLVIRYAQRQSQQGAAALAVRLLASNALWHSSYLFNNILIEHALDAARTQLSATDFDAAWAGGQQLTLDEALALALHSVLSAPEGT